MTGKLDRSAAFLLVLLVAGFVSCASPRSEAAGPSIMVAGWDFSQYYTDGVLSIDGATLTDTLASNYSDLDATHGAGVESAAFGVMYLDGSFGSIDARLDGKDPFLPSSAAHGSLLSNLRAPGGVRFDCFKALKEEGQPLTQPLSMTALTPVKVVFEADLGSVPELGADWSIQFGGRTSVGSVPVEIEFSTDGDSFRQVGSVELSETDSLFTVALGSKRSERAYVRIQLAPDSEKTQYQQAFIDNVALRARLVVAPGSSATPLVRLSPAQRECP